MDDLAGSVSSSEAASGRSTCRLPSCGIFLDGVVELEFTVLEQQQRGAGRHQLGIGKHAKDVIGAQRRPRFFVGPAGAVHIDQLPADEDGGRNAGQDVAIHIALHGGVGLAEIVTLGGHLQVFHCRFPWQHAKVHAAFLRQSRWTSRPGLGIAPDAQRWQLCTASERAAIESRVDCKRGREAPFKSTQRFERLLDPDLT